MMHASTAEVSGNTTAVGKIVVIGGWKILADNGAYFISLTKERADKTTYPEFLYMNPDGTRFVSAGEVRSGKRPLAQEWGWAKETWTNKRVRLNQKEIESAKKIDFWIRREFTYGFTKKQKADRLEFQARYEKEKATEKVADVKKPEAKVFAPRPPQPQPTEKRAVSNPQPKREAKKIPLPQKEMTVVELRNRLNQTAITSKFRVRV